MRRVLKTTLLKAWHLFAVCMLFPFSRKDREMIANIAAIQLQDKYASSRLGLAWSVIQPLSFLVVYTVVFTFAFRPRLEGTESSLTYSIWILAGMVPWLFIAECLNACANAFVSFGSIIKNMVFEVKLIPYAVTLVAFVPFVIGVVFLFGLLFAAGNYPTWHCVFLLLVIVLQYYFFCAVGFWLGTLAVFSRDIIQVVPTFTQIMIFMTPIFYPITMMPRILRMGTFFNPFYQLVNPYRMILIDHAVPDFLGLGYMAILTTALLYLGLRFFKSLRGYFCAAL